MAETRAFNDYFSPLAADYARYRPQYPPDLFEYLASQVPHHHLAWDCGTGSGQAALGLAEHFERVVATDASPEQIARAFPHPRIEYQVAPSEEPGLEAGSANLVTVGTAVHWFNLERFYAAVRGVAAPGCVLAVWTYSTPNLDHELGDVIRRYSEEVLAGWWPERLQFVNDHYQSLPFPFEELDAPPFKMRADWGLGQMAGFLGSWSASRLYQEARGQNPLELILPELKKAWGPERRQVSWDLYLRVGRVRDLEGEA